MAVINGTSGADVLTGAAGALEHLSLDRAGSEAAASAYGSTTSRDGLKVAYLRTSYEFVGGSTIVTWKVMVHDLKMGTVSAVVVNTSPNTASAANELVYPRISPDGAKVVFSTRAALVAGDTNGVGDVYVKDLKSGALTRVSTAASGAQGNDQSFDGVFSPDGTSVAFTSNASNLVAGDVNHNADVFVKNLVTGAITVASTMRPTPELGTGGELASSFSPDGSKLLFESLENELNGSPAHWNVFVRDLRSGQVTPVSASAAGQLSNSTMNHAEAVFSPDGSKVAFASNATNLVAGDTNGAMDIFVKDLRSGAITRVSTSATGVQGNGLSYHAVFSPDGRYLAFTSQASNLVAGDTNGQPDVFVKDLATGAITLVSNYASGAPSAGGSYWAQYLSDGRLTFVSGSDLTNNRPDNHSSVFVLNSASADTLNGNGGNDVLSGGAGDDVLNGGADNDVLDGGDGADKLVGGAGIDTASYATATAGVTVNLGSTAAQNTLGAGVDTISQVENLTGSAYNDVLSGDASNNVIRGGGGADILRGMAGNDTLLGDVGDDVLDGGAGNDVLNGAAGIDTADYASAAAAVKVSLAITGGQNTAGAGNDTLTGIENLTGSAYGDTLTGDGGSNLLSGGGGTDTIRGGAGNDTLTGGAGKDTLFGEGGSDRFSFTALSDSTNAAPDLIKDFAVGDRLDLAALDANTLVGGNQAFHLGGGGGHAGDIMIAYNAAADRTEIKLYVDNNASVDATIWLAGNHPLAPADFVL